MADDELPDFIIPADMKLPGPSDPIGNWLETHATPIQPGKLVENLKQMSRDTTRREWRDQLREGSTN